MRLRKEERSLMIVPSENQLEHSPGQSAWGDPAWAEGLDKMTSSGPFQPWLFCDCFLVLVKPLDTFVCYPCPGTASWRPIFCGKFCAAEPFNEHVVIDSNNTAVTHFLTFLKSMRLVLNVKTWHKQLFFLFRFLYDFSYMTIVNLAFVCFSEIY